MIRAVCRALSLLGDRLLLEGELGEGQVPVVGCSGACTRLPGGTQEAVWSVVSEEIPPSPLPALPPHPIL